MANRGNAHKESYTHLEQSWDNVSSIPAGQSRIPVLNSRPPQKFTFERQIPVVTIDKKRKTTNLKGDLFSKSTTAGNLQSALQNDIAVSPSGRTLSQILSLSHPNDLSTYHIESVNAGWGKDGTVVKYSRPQGTEVDCLREKEELQRKVVELEKIAIEKRNTEEMLMKWQTASLILQAFATFAWSHISDIDKEELEKYGMNNFRDIFYVKWGSTHSAARTVARRIYEKIDADLRYLGERIFYSKQNIGDQRKLLAHPIVPDAVVKEFLEELGYGRPGLQPMEIAVFNYLKATANTKANIEASRG